MATRHERIVHVQDAVGQTDGGKECSLTDAAVAVVALIAIVAIPGLIALVVLKLLSAILHSAGAGNIISF